MPSPNTLDRALRDLASETIPVTETAVRRLRAASPARRGRGVRAAALTRVAAGALLVVGLGALPLPRAIPGVWAMGLSSCPGRLVGDSAGLSTLGCVVDAARTAWARVHAALPDLSRVAHGPRAFTMVTRVDGMAGYDAAERWIGIVRGVSSGSLVVTVTQRNAFHCCVFAELSTDGTSATMSGPHTTIRASDLQALLLSLFVEGLPLADGWQGRLDLPEVRTSTANPRIFLAPATAVPVRVVGRTTTAGTPTWRVVAGRTTLYVDVKRGTVVGTDEPTHLAGHQRELRARR